MMIPNPTRFTKIVRKMISSGRVTTCQHSIQSAPMGLRIADRGLRMGEAVRLLAAAALTAQPAGPTVEFAELEAVAQAELKAINAPGAAIAIVKGDRIVYQKGLGVANVETGQAMTPDMLFRVGSVTKMFTTAALVSLAEDGRLRLGDPIGKYVSGVNSRLAKLTTHQLMSHTAGIR